MEFLIMANKAVEKARTGSAFVQPVSIIHTNHFAALSY